MANWPCSNPSCKSEGRPHPNCKCPAPMAKGGMAGHFCSENRPHDPKCQYFAKGGEAEPLIPTAHPQEDVSAALTAGAHSLFTGNKKYEKDVSRGHKKIKDATESLFDGKESSTIPKPDKEACEKLHKYMQEGGLNSEIGPGMEVEAPHIPSAQNVLMGAAKTRAFNYLNSQRPVPEEFQSKLPFDDPHEDDDKKRSYHEALDVAHHPLGVLDHVKSGSILPEQMAHLKGMYPELTEHLQKKLTDRITKAQLEDKKPPYAVRQGLSLFMGANLSGELVPANIQAAQAVFAPQRAAAQQQSGSTKGKSTKSLSKSDQSFLTSDQALVHRQQGE